MAVLRLDRRRSNSVFRSRAFGLRVEADRPVPGLAEGSFAGEADVRIHFTVPAPSSRGEVTTIQDAADATATNRFVTVTRAGDVIRFDYRDATSFAIDASGDNVWVAWPDDLTIEDATTYLLGPVFGYVLRLRGIVSLHASCVTIDGGAVAFIGDAGAGKSTITAAFALAGREVITDDVLTLRRGHGGRLDAVPSYARVRLWSATVEALFGAAEALPRIVPTHPDWDKRYLPLDGPLFATETRPLRLLYVLQRREGAPETLPMQSRDSLVALIANSYVNYLLDAAMRRTEFELLSDAIRSVPVRSANTGASFSDLPRFRELVECDVAALANGSVT